MLTIRRHRRAVQWAAAACVALFLAVWVGFCLTGCDTLRLVQWVHREAEGEQK
jgi:hypothetical protein